MKRNRPADASAPAPAPLRKPRRPLRFVLRGAAVLGAVVVLLAGGLYGAYRWATRDVQVVPIDVVPHVTVADGSLDGIVLPDEDAGGPLPTPIDGLSDAWDLKRLRQYYTVPIEYRKQRDPLVENLLLLGSDRRDPETLGRTDLMMVLTIDRRHGKLKITSLLRAMKVRIPGRTLENKIHAAYALGGPGLAINTVNRLLSLDIQRYVLVDLESTRRFIDEAGGVRVTLDAQEAAALKLPEGSVVLDGDDAVRFAGLREIDSDTERTERQREILLALVASFRSAGTARQLELVTDALALVETNLTQDDILARLAAAMPGFRGTETFYLPQPGTFDTVEDPVAGTWYVVDWVAARRDFLAFLGQP